MNELEISCKTKDALESFDSFKRHYNRERRSRYRDAAARNVVLAAPPPAYSLIDTNSLSKLSSTKMKPLKPIPKIDGTETSTSGRFGRLVKSKTVGSLQTVPSKLSQVPVGAGNQTEYPGSIAQSTIASNTPFAPLNSNARNQEGNIDASWPSQPRKAKLLRRRTDMDGCWGSNAPAAQLPKSQTLPWLQSSPLKAPPGSDTPGTPKTPGYSGKPQASLKTPDTLVTIGECNASISSSSRKSSGSGTEIFKRVFCEGMGAVRRFGRSFTVSDLAANAREGGVTGKKRMDEKSREWREKSMGGTRW